MAPPTLQNEWTLPGGRGTIRLRRLRTLDEYRACEALQEETWGKEYTDRVPSSILLVTQKIGGLTAGAFDEQDSLVAFVFGITGYTGGTPVHWSDMLAVRPAVRGLGIGTRLKWFQRAEMLKLGVRRISSTFDPLVARNANLNLNLLGASIDEYVPDMYVESESRLHRGLGMDRCVVAWLITSPHVEAIAAGNPPPAREPDPALPVVNSERHRSGVVRPVARPPVESADVLIEIPADIELVRDDSVETARLWRQSTRAAFLHYLHHGYGVRSFVRSPDRDRCFYLLSRRETVP
jgi:predicted GNAT superfamily acetyltransferase